MVFVAAFAAGTASARQVPVFERLSVTDGLSHPKINGLALDEQGFLWIATGGGLDLYDGIRVRHLATGKPPGGYSSSVGPLLLGREGMMFAGTEWGIMMIDPSTFTSTRFPYSFPSGGAPVALAEDANGGIWVAAWTDGLQILDPDSGVFTRKMSDSLQALDVVRGQDDSMWIATATGLARLMPDADEFTFMRYDSERPHSIRSDRVRRITVSDDGRIWVGTESGLDVLDPRSGVFSPVDVGTRSDKMIADLTWDVSGTLWIGYDDALVSLDADSGDYHVFEHAPGDPERMVAGRITAIQTLSGGGLAVGSDRSGLSLSSLNAAALTRVSKTSDARWEFLGLVGAFSELPDGNVLVGGSEGLFKYRPADGSVEMLADVVTLTGGSSINVLHVTRDGHVWMGTEGAGFGQLDMVSLTFNSIPSTRRDEAFVYDIQEDPDGIIWAGTFGGLISAASHGERLDAYRHDDGSGLAANWVSQLDLDANGNLLIGTNLGLSIRGRTSGTFRHIGYGEGVTLRNAGIVSGLWATPEGIFLATGGAGLIELNPSDWTGRQWDVDAELSAVIEDRNGYIWLQSPSGFTRLDRSSGETIRIASDVGVMPFDFALGAYTATTGGDLLFGTQNGFFVLDPEQLAGNNDVPRASLAGVTVRGAHVRTENGQLVAPVASGDMPVVFQYAPDIYPGNKPFALVYRRADASEPWIRLEGPVGDLTFNSLPTGELVYEAAFQSVDGRVGVPATIALTVLPVWYRSWWFTTLSFFGVALAGSGAVAYRVRSIKRDNIRLEQVVIDRTAELEDKRLQLAERNDQLAALDEMKSRFFINISHDFRTPLTLILGPLQDLIDASEGEEKQSIERALRNGQRLLRLINQVMDLARLEAGAFTLEVVPTDVRDLARKTLGAFESIGALRRIQTGLSGGDEPLVVGVDPAQVEVILLNLLSNAFKYTEPGGTVWVDVRAVHEDGVSISVTDSGIGIPEEHLPYLFDRYYRVRAPMGDLLPGSGVGLALVHELVELHQGSISVVSRVGEGSGTTFTITLPSLPWEHGPRPSARPEYEGYYDVFGAASDARDVAHEGDRPTVLVVEDHGDLRAYIREHLDTAYAVAEAADGEDGLALAIELVPDLIISDIMMPRKDGLTLVRELRSDTRTSHIPVILLTARADVESHIEGVETGADSFLPKPFNARVLKAQIASLLERRNLLWNAYRQGTLHEPDDPVVSALDTALVEQISSFVASRLSDPDFSVDELAEYCGMSSRQLSRKMAVVLDTSPGSYIRTQRMREAQQLLSDPNSSVKEVSFRVGFRSETHFSKQFKEAYGVTPGNWSRR